MEQVIKIGIITVIVLITFYVGSQVKKDTVETTEQVQASPTPTPEEKCHYDGLEGREFVYTTSGITLKGKLIKVNCQGNTIMQVSSGDLYSTPSNRLVNGFEVLNPVPETPCKVSTTEQDKEALKNSLNSIDSTKKKIEDMEKQIAELKKQQK